MSRSSFLFFSASIVVLFFLYFFYALGAASFDVSQSKRVFTITAGEGSSEIGDRLLSEHIIRSKTGFLFYGALSNSLRDLKPGDYQLESGISVPALMHLFVSGPPDAVLIVKEGETARDIDSKLSGLGIVEKSAFLAKAQYLEGFLFPDTYRISSKLSIDATIERLLSNFRRRTGSEITAETITILARARNRSAAVAAGTVSRAEANLFDLVTLSSLIEKEAAAFSDRALISDVLGKRLRAGIALQVDSTIVYAKCKGTFYNCPLLTRSDFSLASPYNTYLNPGLPRGPIANPGLSAIQAAQNPTKSPYLYYLSDPQTGKIIFSETFDNHNDNRAQYLGI